MTKSKLEKAKEYAMSRTYPRFDSIFISNFVHREIEGAYLEGSKETENLEHQIKNVQRALNKWVDKAKENKKEVIKLLAQIEQMQDAKCISCTDLGGMLLKITNLEKENAELKETLKTYNGCGDWDTDFHACRVYLQHEELQNLQEENVELKKEVLKVRQHLELTEREWGKDTVKLYHFKTQSTKAKEILQVVLDKWEEERWILQSEEEVRQIEKLMKQAEQFLEKVK